MISIKKITLLAVSAAVVALMAVGLAGCGEPVAATWAHGKIMEEDITKAATNTMSTYVKEDGTTDVEQWTKFIEDRTYETDDEEDADAADSKDKKGSKEEKTESKEKGTVAEYREYLIKQALRDEIIKYQVKEQKIEVTDEEVDAEVESEAAMYEAYYGGGMSGTFESIINNYFGMTMEDFRANVSESLAQKKLQEATVGSEDTASEETEDAEDEAADTKDNDSKDSKKSDKEEVDYDKLFEEYLDSQVESADLKIKDCPADLSYDSAVVAKNAESGEASEDTEDSDESSASDSEDSGSDDATKEEDSSSKENK